MRILYCASDLSCPDATGDNTEAAVLRDLTMAGHEIVAAILVGPEVATLDSRLSDSAVPYEASTADEGLALEDSIRAFAKEVAVRAKEEALDVVLARGVVLNRILAEEGRTREILWSLLSAADLEAVKGAGDMGQSYLRTIVENNRITLVDSPEDLRSVQRAVPSAHHRVVAVGGRAGLDGTPAGVGLSFPVVATLWSAPRRILLYRNSPADAKGDWVAETYAMARLLASADVNVIIMCHDAISLFGAGMLLENPFVTVVEPPSARHQVVEGRLLPRFAAWHVAVAAAALDCCVVLSDDLEMAKYSFANDHLRGRLWPIIEFDGLAEFNDHREIFEGLAATARRLVFTNHASQAALESRIASSTSKTLVLPGLAVASEANDIRSRDGRLSPLFRKHLDRSVADYDSTPRLDVIRRILVAGHDFKFAGELVDLLAQREDVELRVDHWAAQNIQDEPLSRTLLDWAEVIFCEFASHNAVWYSWEKKPNQTLIVRFHGYELWSPWIQDINTANVDKFVFVSEFYRDKVVEELGWPREKTAVMPNVVDTLDLGRPKATEARFHLGMAGIVPILKRPDRALDLLERLLMSDERYTLHIRGRNPWEYGWMWQQEDIRDAYEAFYERLAFNPKLRRRVAFEEFGPDMGRWFQKIGWMLSPSYRETFHLAPVEGMASGAVPVVWEREGAQEIFGSEWVHEDTNSAAEYIIRANEDAAVYSGISQAAAEQSREFDVVKTGREWLNLLFASESAHSTVPATNIVAERQEMLFASSNTAAALARLVAVLRRDGDSNRINELVANHPDLAKELPLELMFESKWTDGVEALKADPPRITERSSGAAYVVRRNAVLFALDGHGSKGSARRLAAACRQEIDNGSLRLVAVTSGAVDPGFDSKLPSRSDVQVDGLPAIRHSLRHSDPLRVDKFVMAAADAIVREARTFRPAAIASGGEFWVALPALLAARRLGIPFLVEAETGQDQRRDDSLSLLCRSEADAVFRSGTCPTHCLQEGIQKYGDAIVPSVQRELSTLKVGVISDQFTARTISHSFETVPLSRSGGYVQVATLDLDAVFVESAWEGPDYEWRRGVAYYPDENDDLRRIVEVAKARKIPVIFWNKEDPVHFRAFEKTAAMMDHIFTTDADMVGKYLQSDESKAETVSSMPFYAEPAIHNPMPTDRPYVHSVSYAGTYYGDRFKERSIELHKILDVSKTHGLTIYDRQVNVTDSPYRFPPELSSYVREGVPYDEVLEVYKAHPVNINVNSANDSPTMFSRRVVEIAASGSVVLSGKGRGITEQLQGIEASGSDERWAELLGVWMTDEGGRIKEAWRQMRTVTRSHLAGHSLTILMRTAGVPVTAPQLPSYAVVLAALASENVESILRQSWRPSVVYTEMAAHHDVKRLQENGIKVSSPSQVDADVEWVAFWTNVPTDTYFEDILHATRFGGWDYLSGRPYAEEDGIGKPIVELERSGVFAELRRSGRDGGARDDAPLTWVMPRT